MTAELIKRLEGATEGSRELDAEAHLGPAWYDEEDDSWRVQYGDTAATIDLPHYTTSLDAALMLVPEGCDIGMRDPNTAGNDNEPSKCLAFLYLPFAPWQTSGKAPSKQLALALCIAALKARMAMLKEGGPPQ